MNLKQLQYFIQVARHGSLSHAATALRMGQQGRVHEGHDFSTHSHRVRQ